MVHHNSLRPVRQWATVAKGPASPLLPCGPRGEVAHPDDVVTQKRRFANIGTRAPACATPLSMCRADRADKNRIFLGGRRQGACRSSLGLHGIAPCIAPINIRRRPLPKMYVDKMFEMLLIKTVRGFLSYFGNPMSGFF